MMSCESNQDILGITAMDYSRQEGVILSCVLHNCCGLLVFTFIILPSGLLEFASPY